MDTPSEQHDDWLLSPTAATSAEAPEPTEVIGDGTPVQPTDVAPRQGRSHWLGASGLVAAGLVAGAVGTFALGHHGTTTTTFQPAGNSIQNGLPPGGFAGGGGPGGMAGEERVQGTVEGVSGSTLRVTTSSGTTSYAITSSTEVIRNGQAASLSELKKGDPVIVHVITSNGSTFIERVIAGDLAQGFMGGPMGGPPGQSQQQTQPGGVVNG